MDTGTSSRKGGTHAVPSAEPDPDPDPDADPDAVADPDRESLYGLDPRYYLGMVHYGYVPLDGQCSDLTARLHIKKVGDDRLTLEFLDIHVM